MIAEELPAALGDQRLDRVVALMADVSRAVAASLVTAGAVRVNGEVAAVGRVRLSAGDLVEIDDSAIPGELVPAPDPEVPIRVVYEDDDLIVVDKQAGLVVHPGAGTPDGTMVNGLLARYPELMGVGEPVRPGIVHRLDAGSSGLLVVARRAAVLEPLMAQFSDHSAGRRYRALVWGHPAASHGVIDAPIGRHPRDPTRMAVTVDGRPSRTGYRVQRLFDDPAAMSLLECRLETGRTHQIRVHLTSIGHPLVGDRVYGERASDLDRPFLHAFELSFRHPSSGEWLTFDSPLPQDLETFLSGLGEGMPAGEPPDGRNDRADRSERGG